MKNKEVLKKYIIFTIVVFAIFMIILAIVNHIQYSSYNRNSNLAINQIINNIKKSYPEADINEIIQILNNDNLEQTDFLKEYGINIDKDTAVLSNQQDSKLFIIINCSILLTLLIVIICIFVKYNKNQNKKISEITKYIEDINRGIYTLSIQENSEDELSILKNELYKITVMLREQSENSIKDKMQLKKSLEDISHQLKTPLTSITIMLDNLLDNPNMDVDIRNDFIKSIYREISNINFFIQALLKLSKFDANTIKFNRKEEKIRDVIEQAQQNVETLCDLRKIKIEVIPNLGQEPFRNPEVVCDIKWQVEAITNIIKNCVEHSESGTKISIKYGKNDLYSEILIEDQGSGIDPEDLKHIFERFYKGKNSSKDSVGIGLSLAKTIIEKDNGYITVESEMGKGSKFCIRYLNG